MPCVEITDTICYKHDRIMELVREIRVGPDQTPLLSEIYKLSCEAKYSGIRMVRRLKERKNHVHGLVSELEKMGCSQVDVSQFNISKV